MSNVMGMYRGQGKNGEWHYGSLVIAESFVKRMPKQHSPTWIVSSAFGNGGWFNIRCRNWVDKETVGQQTPFTCRYGQPLFQGMQVICTPTEEFEEEGQSERTIGMSKNGQWVCFLYASDGEEESAMPINWGGWRSIEIIKD